MALRLKETDGGKAAAGFIERRDCTVRALAIAADLPYATAHDIAKRSGRPNYNGWFPEKILKLAANENVLKFVSFPVPKKTKFRRVRTIYGIELREKFVLPTLGHIVARFPKGRYIISTRTHAMALIDGVIHDQFLKGPHCGVETIFEVLPATQPKIAAPEAPQPHSTPIPAITQTQINELWDRLNRLEERK